LAIVGRIGGILIIIPEVFFLRAIKDGLPVTLFNVIQIIHIIHKSYREQAGIEHSSFRLGESAGEDILAALRGFCLLILKIHTAGISAKETAQILYTALSRDNLAKIHE
jgi:hypothetical protein